MALSSLTLRKVWHLWHFNLKILIYILKTTFFLSFFPLSLTNADITAFLFIFLFFLPYALHYFKSATSATVIL